MDTINIIGYNPCSVADGDGLREVLYIALCTHHCPFCQNQKYWNDKGKEYSIDYLVNKLITNPLTNITLSGGDGLTVQYENTLELLKQLKNKSNKNIWVYTGYTWEELFEICDECFQVHLSPVRSSCHFNRWLGCLKNKNRKRSVYRTEK